MSLLGPVHMRLEADTPATLFVVLADPAPHEADEFQRWYDEVHGPDALGNGSFVALDRFAVAGPGHVAAPFLAFWEGRFADETEAWAYIRPRAMELRAAGRAGDIASVTFAIMLVRARTFADSRATEPVRSLVTVQSDWRDAATNPSVDAWWDATGLDRAPAADGRWLATSDPAGRGAGFHLAAFASSAPLDEVRGAWAAWSSAEGAAVAGMSPVPPYTTIFGTPAEPVGEPPAHAGAWIQFWEPIAAQRIPGS